MNIFMSITKFPQFRLSLCRNENIIKQYFDTHALTAFNSSLRIDQNGSLFKVIVFCEVIS